MDAQGVFVSGVSGMGPALSAEGERIVNAKVAERDRLLDDLEKRGLDVNALSHRHRLCYKREHEHDRASGHEETLEEAQSRIRLQKAQIEHLNHLLAVQENKVLLLREALDAAQNKERTAQDEQTRARKA
ncbi:hypothetical protein [Eggerthella guodeyinii]|uniref:Uncharacterized protein n=1 Tax=Eggerthella guodeyinii TaxID=2690837 RepID=A0A6N7RS98_9ACTN|nr:hypothetical protein [Eggerthella guodeyinii]MRX83892.1 hypothetical protein [Eggerthella guodeyinii]